MKSESMVDKNDINPLYVHYYNDTITEIGDPKVMKGKGNMQGLWEDTYGTLFKSFKEQEAVEGTNDIDFEGKFVAVEVGEGLVFCGNIKFSGDFYSLIGVCKGFALCGINLYRVGKLRGVRHTEGAALIGEIHKKDEGAVNRRAGGEIAVDGDRLTVERFEIIVTESLFEGEL